MVVDYYWHSICQQSQVFIADASSEQHQKIEAQAISSWKYCAPESIMMYRK